MHHMVLLFNVNRVQNYRCRCYKRWKKCDFRGNFE
nr:MAG TPA: hypothetical protein [Caudoviricetes sp.]